MGHSMGHDVLSDFADRPAGDPLLGIYKNCGFWTHDEAAILFNIAKQVGGHWLDIGAHTGWTGAHQERAGCAVLAVDNMFAVPAFYERFRENAGEDMGDFKGTSDEFFMLRGVGPFDGIVIDGDHCHPHPLRDANNAILNLEDDGVILFHDFIGKPVRDAVQFLQGHGFKCRVYWTPHMVACCWHGNFTPPDHERDPRIHWEAVKQSMHDFDFGRCV
jgi:hypothetical protein